MTEPSATVAADVARRLRILSHPERLRILDVLRREPECVCHLEAVLGRPQPYISQQVGVLRTAGIIADEKDGLNVYYRVVDPEVVEWLAALLGPIAPDEDTGSIRQTSGNCCCPKCSAAAETASLANRAGDRRRSAE